MLRRAASSSKLSQPILRAISYSHSTGSEFACAAATRGLRPDDTISAAASPTPSCASASSTVAALSGSGSIPGTSASDPGPAWPAPERTSRPGFADTVRGLADGRFGRIAEAPGAPARAPDRAFAPDPADGTEDEPEPLSGARAVPGSEASGFRATTPLSGAVGVGALSAVRSAVVPNRRARPSTAAAAAPAAAHPQALRHAATTEGCSRASSLSLRRSHPPGGGLTRSSDVKLSSARSIPLCCPQTLAAPSALRVGSSRSVRNVNMQEMSCHRDPFAVHSPTPHLWATAAQPSETLRAPVRRK